MRRLPNLLLLFAVIAFAGSCLAWVLMDQSVWPWDEAFYGDFTLQVWRAKVLGPAGWLDAMFHPLFGLMPPLIVWTGQFFVPLRHLTGDFESALLLLNVAASCGALTLIYFISRNITRDRVAALIGMLVCASSPLFVAMTLLYRVEAVQSLTVAVMMFAAWQAARLSMVSMTASCRPMSALDARRAEEATTAATFTGIRPVLRDRSNSMAAATRLTAALRRRQYGAGSLRATPRTER